MSPPLPKTPVQGLISAYKHPEKAVSNALSEFNVNEKEQDIIKCHMFPLNINIPKYKESWIVSLYDKKAAIIELTCKLGYKLRYASNLTLLLLFNFMK